MKKKNLYIAIACLSLLSLNTSAQNRTYDGPNKMNTWSITGYGGITKFFGDLKEYDFKLGENEKLTGGWGLSVNKQLSPIFGVQLTGYNGQLQGSKMGVQSSITGNTYNASFNSPSFIQLTLDGTVNLNRLLLGPNKMRHWKIDAHLGGGIMYYHTDLKYSNLDTGVSGEFSSNTNASSKTAGTWERNGSTYTREWVVPAGLAVHYELSPRFDLGVDFTYSYVNTEKLDLTVGGLSDYQSQAGIWTFAKGDSKNDGWGMASIALTYKLGKNPVKSKDGVYNTESGRYHLRWADPKSLIPVPYNPTLDDADSVAKANMPKPVDPRLYTDSDGDGVADLFDKEANTPMGSIVSGGGVAMDLDKIIRDAIKNNLPKDECEALFSNIEFDTDKAIIRNASKETLSKVVELLNMRVNCRIVLVGHTDARASDSYNVALSRRRVDAAKRFLIRAGLQDPSRIIAEYYGELRPIADNSSVEGLQSNRRVEIKILPQNSIRSTYPAGFRK
ncbi:OOP family OmpA-OmpF porin [Dyadobacter jejuensis]|uniref:OOP family OmpA-OmpF porin n=1 Tax=Dyadobacter jejuensis TaxID=1082580 RepID=A0A316AKR8_9BACT|nr:OmpA family protein [Dyadobacter jejuensis]PWJ58191.1 OOP family OmpA-OmpF porin [Dyadobacter jejuensis]